MTIELSQTELESLRWLKWRGGVCKYHVEGPQQLGLFGELITPGTRTLSKLIKKGLVLLTEEVDDFSPMYDITDLGEEVLKQYFDK